MRVLGIIPARGGSKGIPRKNLRPLGGKPLIVWSIEAARQATRLARVIVSTDDDELAALAQAAGADVPFRRPAALAGDATPTLPVIQHALATLEAAGDHYDATCILQPTSPLRTAEMIDACIERFAASGADALVSVLPVPHEYNPHWVYVGDPAHELRIATGETEPIARRQELPPAYHRDGSIFITRRDVIAGGSLYGTRVVGYASDPRRHVDIDTLEHWAHAEALLKELSSAS